MFTHHFYQRLFERCGIVLSREERKEISQTILVFMAAEPQQTKPLELEIVLRHRSEIFVVVYHPLNNVLMTAYRRSRRRTKPTPPVKPQGGKRPNYASRKAGRQASLHQLIQEGLEAV